MKPDSRPKPETQDNSLEVKRIKVAEITTAVTTLNTLSPAARNGHLAVSVVIPIFNEKSTILEVLERVQQEKHVHEIIVIDDGSTDGTRELLASQVEEKIEGVIVEYLERNSGKGAALRRGFSRVTGNVVIIQDADLEYEPNNYAKLLQPIQQGRADVVYGSRFKGETGRVLFFWHSVGNKFLTLFSNTLTNLNLTDIETGYKVFRTEVIKGMTLRSNRFGFEPEFTAKMAKGGWRVYEVPITYYGRDYSEGKKITWRDGVMALFQILRYRWFD